MAKKHTILAIGAHPDDIEIGCGGVMLISKKRKYDSHILVLTKGEYGGRSALRVKEQEKAAKFLNTSLHWGGLVDTETVLDKHVIGIIEEHIEKIKPDIIFTPYFNDTHQDHRNISTATMTASRHIRNVLFYEVPTSTNFMPNTYVNIGSVLNDKIKVLRIHSSQINKTKVAGLNILENAKSVAVFRGVQDRVKYAEAFLPLRLSLEKFEG